MVLFRFCSVGSFLILTSLFKAEVNCTYLTIHGDFDKQNVFQDGANSHSFSNFGSEIELNINPYPTMDSQTQQSTEATVLQPETPYAKNQWRSDSMINQIKLWNKKNKKKFMVLQPVVQYVLKYNPESEDDEEEEEQNYDSSDELGRNGNLKTQNFDTISSREYNTQSRQQDNQGNVNYYNYPEIDDRIPRPFSSQDLVGAYGVPQQRYQNMNQNSNQRVQFDNQPSSIDNLQFQMSTMNNNAENLNANRQLQTLLSNLRTAFGWAYLTSNNLIPLSTSQLQAQIQSQNNSSMSSLSSQQNIQNDYPQRQNSATNQTASGLNQNMPQPSNNNMQQRPTLQYGPPEFIRNQNSNTNPSFNNQVLSQNNNLQNNVVQNSQMQLQPNVQYPSQQSSQTGTSNNQQQSLTTLSLGQSISQGLQPTSLNQNAVSSAVSNQQSQLQLNNQNLVQSLSPTVTSANSQTGVQNTQSGILIASPQSEKIKGSIKGSTEAESNLETGNTDYSSQQSGNRQPPPVRSRGRRWRNSRGPLNAYFKVLVAGGIGRNSGHEFAGQIDKEINAQFQNRAYSHEGRSINSRQRNIGMVQNNSKSVNYGSV